MYVCLYARFGRSRITSKRSSGVCVRLYLLRSLGNRLSAMTSIAQLDARSCTAYSAGDSVALVPAKILSTCILHTVEWPAATLYLDAECRRILTNCCLSLQWQSWVWNDEQHKFTVMRNLISASAWIERWKQAEGIEGCRSFVNTYNAYNKESCPLQRSN